MNTDEDKDEGGEDIEPRSTYKKADQNLQLRPR
jgi:hypothetical protein